MIYRSNLFYYLLVIHIATLFGYVNSKDLYSDTNDVLRLNHKTFEQTVFGNHDNITYMVQFYNTFCGHCQQFAPIYKELATRVRNWTSVIQIAGVDCSKDENIATCSENNILGYPTILIFPPNCNKIDDKPLDIRSLNIEWTVDDIEESMVNYLRNLTLTKRQIPLAVKALEPIQATSLKDVKRIYPANIGHDKAINEMHESQDLMFIIESEKSFLGSKLIIEYFRISSRLELRRILLTNQQLIKEILTSYDFGQLNKQQPILVRLKNDSTGERQKGHVFVKGEISHILPTSEESERQDYVYNRFNTFLDSYYSVELKDIDQNQEKSYRIEHVLNKPIKINVDQKSNRNTEELEIHYLVHNDPIGSKKIFSVDLLKAITYMITHEIKLKGNLKPDEYQTVRNLLTVIKKYIPLTTWDPDLHRMIDDLKTRLDNNRIKYEKSGVEAQEMKDILNLSGAESIRLKYSRENWISCYDSDRQNKGYTCSLWLLFHTLTVGEYVKAAPVLVRPTMVLMTMKNYIIKFLGCSVCSLNFQKETESLDDNLKYRNSSVLWIWNTHNMINQRINNEKHNDKKPLSDVIFPSLGRCPDCLKTGQKDIGLDGKSYEDIEWNTTNVFNYLLNFYKPEQIITPAETAALLAKAKGKLNYDLIDIGTNYPGAKKFSSPDMNRSVEQWNIQSLFSTSDMGICLILYVSCVVIVALVCVALNPKLRRLKNK